MIPKGLCQGRIGHPGIASKKTFNEVADAIGVGVVVVVARAIPEFVEIQDSVVILVPDGDAGRERIHVVIEFELIGESVAVTVQRRQEDGGGVPDL